MAYEAILQTDGVSFVSTADLRNSTLSGTTRLGQNGSGQFLAVKASTVAAGVAFVTTANTSVPYGILQNKPGVGDVMSIAVFGISKAVAGSTSIAAGQDLMVDTSGALAPYSSAAGQQKFAKQVGATLPTAIGEIFSVALYGFGNGGGSVA